LDKIVKIQSRCEQQRGYLKTILLNYRKTRIATTSLKNLKSEMAAAQQLYIRRKTAILIATRLQIKILRISLLTYCIHPYIINLATIRKS